MSVYALTAVAAAFAVLSTASAHGKVTGIVAGGQYYPGYTIDFAYTDNPPPVVGWSVPDDKDTGFINPGNFSNPDIICHKGATPAQKYVTVAAGAIVELQWSEWPESHHGPVMDYLANCNGECTVAEKTKLQFNKIDEQGLVSWTAQPGSWASDKLIAANNSWTVTIPKSVAPGNYVLRHEIIALHSSGESDGAQNYPQCINLKVTGSGTDKLASGTLGTKLYTPTDPGILVNIYNKLTTYAIPGPKLYTGAEAGTDPIATAAATTAATAAPSSDGYEATPTASGPSSTAVIAPTTAAPFPTGLYTNTTAISVMGSPTKTGTKKPGNSTGNAFPVDSPRKVHKGPDVGGGYPAIIATSTTEATSATATEAPVIPTSADRSPLSSGAPSVTPEQSGSEAKESPEDSKQLPEGMTVKELLERLQIIVNELQARMGGDEKVRRHARDFLGL